MKDKNIKENTLFEINYSIFNTLNNSRFITMLNSARDNWLNISIEDVTNSILEYIKSLEIVEV